MVSLMMEKMVMSLRLPLRLLLMLFLAVGEPLVAEKPTPFRNCGVH